MQRVKFVKEASGYTDCRTLRYFKVGDICTVNDSLVKNFLSRGSIVVLDEEKTIVEKVYNLVLEDKTDKKIKTRVKKLGKKKGG